MWEREQLYNWWWTVENVEINEETESVHFKCHRQDKNLAEIPLGKSLCNGLILSQACSHPNISHLIIASNATHSPWDLACMLPKPFAGIKSLLGQWTRYHHSIGLLVVMRYLPKKHPCHMSVLLQNAEKKTHEKKTCMITSYSFKNISVIHHPSFKSFKI